MSAADRVASKYAAKNPALVDLSRMMGRGKTVFAAYLAKETGYEWAADARTERSATVIFRFDPKPEDKYGHVEVRVSLSAKEESKFHVEVLFSQYSGGRWYETMTLSREDFTASKVMTNVAKEIARRNSGDKTKELSDISKAASDSVVRLEALTEAVEDLSALVATLKAETLATNQKKIQAAVAVAQEKVKSLASYLSQIDTLAYYLDGEDLETAGLPSPVTENPVRRTARNPRHSP